MDFNNLFLKYTTSKVVKLIKYNVQSGIYVYLLNFWFMYLYMRSVFIKTYK